MASHLSIDTIDDLIYAARTSDLEFLQESVPHHAQSLKISEAEVISRAIDVDDEGMGSRTCLLHYPAANGDVEMLKWLLERLAPVPTASTDATTNVATRQLPPVDSTSSLGNSSPPKPTPKIPLTNHRNISGNTPLHWAALNGHLEVIKLLVNAGADPTIVNEAGRDAVVEAEYSAKEGTDVCANWLLKECEVLEQGAGMREGEGEGKRDDENEGAEEDVVMRSGDVEEDVNEAVQEKSTTGDAGPST